MKRTYGIPKIFFIFWILLLQWVAAFEVQAVPSITVGAVSGAPGEVVQLPIVFVNDGTVVGMQLDVVFPNGFTSAAEGPFASRGAAIPFIEGGFNFSTSKIGNNVRIVIFDQSAPIGLIGSDVLVTIPVTVGATTTTGDHVFALEGVVLSDIHTAAVVPTSTDAGKVTVTSIFIIVPSVVSQTQAAATTTLRGLGLVVVTRFSPHASVPEGRVISQNPVATTTVSAGATVNLVISSGPVSTDVTVPSVSGQTQAAATTALRGLGLVVTTRSSPHASVLEGRVISQNPAATTTVSAGATINLVISSGPVSTDVTVPSVSGQTQAAATTALRGLGLVVTTASANDSNVPAGNVISFAPSAGSIVTPGTIVNLVISVGPVVNAGAKSHPIPTLSFWGLLGLSALMPGVLGWLSRRKKIK